MNASQPWESPAYRRGKDVKLIDCDTCEARGARCSGSAPADLGPAEHRAIEVFARAGFEVQVLPTLPAPRPSARRRIA